MAPETPRPTAAGRESALRADLPDKMPIKEFRFLRDGIRETYGDLPSEPNARRDQELGALYLRSHWTQSEIAAVERKSQTWVSRRLLLARFLRFAPPEVRDMETVKTMSEGRFRAYWNQTSDEIGERHRFASIVEELLKTPPQKISNRIAQRLREDYGDGQWHTVEDVAHELEVDRDKVNAAVDRIQKSPRFDAPLVLRGLGDKGRPSIRIASTGRHVPSPEIADALAPIIRKLRRIKTVKAAQTIAAELEALVVDWTAGSVREVNLGEDGSPF